jgi:hypothetical protein
VATAFFGGAFFSGEFFSSTPIPPTPTSTTSYDGGGGYVGAYDSKKRKKLWDAQLEDKKELRRLIVLAMEGAKESVETVARAEEIAEKYTPPKTKSRPEPRIDYAKLLKDIEAVEWLLKTYEQQRMDDDDEEVLLLH